MRFQKDFCTRGNEPRVSRPRMSPKIATLFVDKQVDRPQKITFKLIDGPILAPWWFDKMHNVNDCESIHAGDASSTLDGGRTNVRWQINRPVRYFCDRLAA